ncbi:hypothetical protein BDV97DRAFT_362936 [Delphinella strobiligena]|nr:hypothetical protein BDV97DRAFT_362936 [Delphinella strobiligena]
MVPNRLDPRVDLGDKTATKHEESKNPFSLSRVLSSKQLYSPNSRPQRECIHVEFDLRETGLTYTTGDHVGVWPTNPEPELDRLLRVLRLNQQKDTVIVSNNTDKSNLEGSKDLTTYSVVLRHKLEICGAISRESLHTISNFAPTQDAKDILLQLYNDKEYFHSFVISRCLNLGQILEIASQGQPWRALPFAALYDFLPALQPLYYSIPSSNAEYPHSLHIMTAIKSDVIEPGVRNFYGVASNYLRALTRANDNTLVDTIDETSFELTNPRTQENILACAIFVRQSTFRLPPDPRTPIIMVGPCTGVAPFRAFIQERDRLARQGTQVGKSVLYFGCRKQSEDFLYADDWEAAKRNLGDNFLLRTAFSRDSSQKVYVQQRLLEDGRDVFRLLEAQRAWFYICGDAKHTAESIYKT